MIGAIMGQPCCSHSLAISGDRWPDDVRPSDIESRFICGACATAALTCGRISTGIGRPRQRWGIADGRANCYLIVACTVITDVPDAVGP
jgi:hypothetical protein